MKASKPDGVYFAQECYLQKIARANCLMACIHFIRGLYPEFYLVGLNQIMGWNYGFFFLWMDFQKIPRRKKESSTSLIMRNIFFLHPYSYMLAKQTK